MGTTLKFEHNSKGIGELLRSEGVRADLERRARAVGAAAQGETDMPILVEDHTGNTRARFRIVAEDSRAKAVEAKTRLLGRAIDAAR